MIHRRNIQIDGVQLSYIEQGSPTPGRPSLVLLHGLMGCADTMRGLMVELLPSIHAIALDFPGAGQSERRKDIVPTLAATATITRRFVEELSLKDACLCGHSHGGAVALQMAATRPGSLRSLALIAPAHPYFVEADPLIRFYLSLPGRLFSYTLPWYPRWMQMIGLRRMAGPKSWDTIEKLKPYRDNLQTAGTMSHLLRLLTNWHADFAALRRLLRDSPIRTPTMLLWGDADRAVPPFSVHELRARIDYTELHVLKDVGHRPAEERPAEVAAYLADWLARTPGEIAAYKPNSSVSQARIAANISPSLGVGDAGRPAKK